MVGGFHPSFKHDDGMCRPPGVAGAIRGEFLGEADWGRLPLRGGGRGVSVMRTGVARPWQTEHQWTRLSEQIRYFLAQQRAEEYERTGPRKRKRVGVMECNIHSVYCGGARGGARRGPLSAQAGLRAAPDDNLRTEPSRTADGSRSARLPHVFITPWTGLRGKCAGWMEPDRQV